MSVPRKASNTPEKLPAGDLQLVFSLFFMGLGYALLSFCLFRMLCFINFSAPFFVLYIGIGFPAGALLVSFFIRDLYTGLKLVIMALPLASAGVLAVGVLATSLWGNALEQISLDVNFSLLFLAIVGVSIISIPFFVLWGAAEFIGFKVVLANSRLRHFFYVITICALLASFIIGNWSVPELGILKTAAVVPFFSLLAAALFFRRRHFLRFILLLCCFSALWVLAGTFETAYSKKLFLSNALNTIKQHHNINDDSSWSPILLKSLWGKYCHISIFHWRDESNPYAMDTIRCCYDGSPMWVTSLVKGNDIFDYAIFDGLKKNADICIIGSGGGKQIGHAIETEPRSIVAVDIVPEIFNELKGELSWVNGSMYNLPVVETVSMDGVSYIETCNRKFDLIALPGTESFSMILKSFFEYGQRLHTLESFTLFSDHLKPGGKIVIFKNLDIDRNLFYSFAKTLKAAGLNVSGFTIEGFPFDHLLLFGSKETPPHIYSEKTLSGLWQFRGSFVDFQRVSAPGVVLTENSPWSHGILGNIAPIKTLNTLFLVLIFLLIGSVAVLAFLPFTFGNRESSTSARSKTLYAFAGCFVGINAIYLENGIIFWFISNLTNPLAAFFIGSSVFLVLWGTSNLKETSWKYLTAIAIVGALGLLFSHQWSNHLAFTCILLIAAGSGFCFSHLTLRFETQLLNLFIFDALGSFIGGVLGIGIPFFYGFNYYFTLLPLLALATLATALWAGAAAKQLPDITHPESYSIN